ncbi:MAG: formate/nitrite transporter family protein [Actinomycetota bacterium]|nr:formate/nitrite transporter family protein [Actinomycetota bacterium]
MAYNTPQETAALAVESGVAKANLPPDRALVGGFLAGAYIAFGGLLAIVCSAGLNPAQWGGLVTLVTGLVFSLGLILTIIGGAELLTGNMALLPMAALQKRITLAQLAMNWLWLTIGNLVGSLFVAYMFADKTGLIGTSASKAGTPAASNFARLSGITIGKAVTETHLQQFLRAVGCNWLVCLAVFLAIAATDVAGKILAIVFPITAFVALGFDHVVANMFFLPAALWLHVDGVTFSNTVSNLIFAYLGNAVGAALFVGAAYWYVYLREREREPGAPAAAARAGGVRSDARRAG